MFDLKSKKMYKKVFKIDTQRFENKSRLFYTKRVLVTKIYLISFDDSFLYSFIQTVPRNSSLCCG